MLGYQIDFRENLNFVLKGAYNYMDSTVVLIHFIEQKGQEAFLSSP